MTIDRMRTDIARRSKRGLSFILASIVLWSAIGVIWLLPLPSIPTKNLITFFCAVPLLPLAFVFSKIIGAEFSPEDNPLHSLGMLFSINQVLYLLIAVWAFAGVPEKLVMIIAVIFGAHLLPFSWLYRSRAYLVMSVIIPLGAISLGGGLPSNQIVVVPGFMVLTGAVFSLWLFLENKEIQGHS
ncbi:MAG: hypothetical protein LUO93_11565 [Methanomicrobiales archaeon]|nr:hypothetical protein [Methanomicrobiales archaeon]